MLELSEEQRQALEQHPGVPLEIIHPQTRRVYLLVEAEQYRRMCGPDGGDLEEPPLPLPPGIARARAAFRRDLPQLLGDARWRGKCVAYAWDERIAIADSCTELIRECLRRGLADDEFYLGVIEPAAAVDEEDVSYGLLEAEAIERWSPADAGSAP